MPYTHDWFTPNIPVWEKLFAEFKNVALVHFLEIGCYEGMSTVWLLKNILTAEGAFIDVIDPFDSGTQPRNADGSFQDVKDYPFDHTLENFIQNIEPWKIRVKLWKMCSEDILPTRLNDSSYLYDAIYIDGSHAACNVLEDAVLSFRLLKKGGIMLFDDYEWQPQLAPHKTPKLAVDAFIAAYHGQLEVIHRGYQVAIRKI